MAGVPIANQSVLAIFAAFQDYIDNEQKAKEEIKEQVKELENVSRQLQMLLQSVHHPEGLKNVSAICQQGRTILDGVKMHYQRLASRIPANEYYRYSDNWRFVTQKLVFSAALINFLENGSLLSKEDAAQLFGLHARRQDGFPLDLEDYLHGLLHLASELSRLAVNAVTASDYEKPRKIAQFLNDLEVGFRLLNLKNDSLRKRFDGLKYELKKVEEVVYDLSIRGLKPAQ